MSAKASACRPGELPVLSIAEASVPADQDPVPAEISQQWAWWAALPSSAGVHFAGVWITALLRLALLQALSLPFVAGDTGWG